MPITIGYGSTRNLNFKLFSLGDRITEDEAIALLKRDVSASCLRMSTSPGWNDLTTSQKAALIDLSYNGGYFYGCGRCDSLDLAMKDRNYDDIGLILQKYDNGDELGLSRRRYAEWLMWNGTEAKSAYEKAWAITSVAAIMQNLTA